MKHFKNAQRMEVSSLNMDGINTYLEEIVSSEDQQKPITCGLFRMEKGNPLEYTYSYDEMKVMLEGEMTIKDGSGKSVDMRPGDVVSFGKGETITFTSGSFGLAFFCGQRAPGEL